MKEPLVRMPSFASLENDDERFMCQALKEAWKAFEDGEVPVGAVVVFEGTIIARARNQTEQLLDATAHAEMLALGQAESFLANWRLEECTLYSTLEPCIMCAGASILCRLKRLVWGAPDFRHGANGSILDVFEINHPIHRVDISSHILQDWCALPLKLFFQKRREEVLSNPKNNIIK